MTKPKIWILRYKKKWQEVQRPNPKKQRDFTVRKQWESEKKSTKRKIEDMAQESNLNCETSITTCKKYIPNSGKCNLWKKCNSSLPKSLPYYQHAMKGAVRKQFKLSTVVEQMLQTNEPIAKGTPIVSLNVSALNTTTGEAQDASVKVSAEQLKSYFDAVAQLSGNSEVNAAMQDKNQVVVDAKTDDGANVTIALQATSSPQPAPTALPSTVEQVAAVEHLAAKGITKAQAVAHSPGSSGSHGSQFQKLPKMLVDVMNAEQRQAYKQQLRAHNAKNKK